MEQKIFDVSEVNDYIKTIMDGDGLLTAPSTPGELGDSPA